MKRLSIDKVIDLVVKNIMISQYVNYNLTGRKCISEYDFALNKIPKLLKQLKAYKDAEKQGLLLRLPCKIGTTVYSIDRQIWIDEKGCKDCVYYAVDGSCDYEEEHPACTKVYETKFKFNMCDEFGKTVFLTREEAEQALADIKGV